MTVQLRHKVQPVRSIDLDQYVSGDVTEWPAGQTTLTVTFTDTGGTLPGYGVLRADYDSSVLTAMRITQVSFRNRQRINTAGNGIAAADFAVFSGTPSNTLFPMPRAPYILVITLAVNVAPLADEDVVFHLRPPDQLPEAMAEATKRRAVPVAKNFARLKAPALIKRAAAAPKPRSGFVDKLKSFGRGVWRRMPFVAGQMSDAVAGQLLGVLGSGYEDEIVQVGEQALDDFVMGMADVLGQELADSPEFAEFVGELVDVLGEVVSLPADEEPL